MAIQGLVKRKTVDTLFHVNAAGEIVDGLHPNLDVVGWRSQISGNCTELRGHNTDIRGDVSGLRGNCSFLYGDVSGLRGNCTGLIGHCTGLFGDLDKCGITEAERREGFSISELVDFGA